jgi:hypothetical protein
LSVVGGEAFRQGNITTFVEQTVSKPTRAFIFEDIPDGRLFIAEGLRGL